MGRGRAAVAVAMLTGALLWVPSAVTAQDGTPIAATPTAGASLSPDLRRVIQNVVDEHLDVLTPEQREAILDDAAAMAAGRTRPPATPWPARSVGTEEEDDSLPGLIILLSAILGVGIMVVGRPVRSGGAGRRRVIYRFGGTDRELILGGPQGGARTALVRPFVDRSVSVDGELAAAWDDVRDTLPQGWAVARPRLDARRRQWSVSAEGPFNVAAVDRQRIEATDQTEIAALARLARSLASLPTRSSAAQAPADGALVGRSWRPYVRNPYRLPVHGRHFFLLPEAWYDDREDERQTDLSDLLMWGISGRKLALSGLDFWLTFGLPIVVALAVFQTCAA